MKTKGFRIRDARVHDVGPGLLLQIADDRGLVGQGEATPRAGYSPDSKEACAALLNDFDWDGLPRIDLGGAVLQRVAEAISGIDEELPACRFAVETALLDLAGQHLSCSLARLLGGGSANDTVALSALLPVSDSLVVVARDAVARGITTLKLKVGEKPAQADHQLEALRSEVGNFVQIRLDANQALSPNEAPGYLTRWAEHAPAFIEEPVAFKDLGELGLAPIPIALDESLQEQEVVAKLDRLLSSGTISTLVLKPMALGGSIRCLKIAGLAAKFHRGVVVTHLFDGPVGLCAAAALARALPNSLPCGLDAHDELAGWPAVPLPFLDHSCVRSTGRPGLGLDRITPT